MNNDKKYQKYEHQAKKQRNMCADCISEYREIGYWEDYEFEAEKEGN
jgi:hypothetical protein